MEKRLIENNSHFHVWLEKLIYSDKVDFYLLYKLRDEKRSSADFEIHISDMKRIRIAISKEQGYLSFTSENKDVIKNYTEELLEFGLKFVKSGTITNSGFANFLILIDRLGSSGAELKQFIIEQLCLAAEEKLFSGMLNALIDTYNTEYNFSNSKSKKLSFKEWEDLFVSIQYLEHFNNPIDLLRSILHFRRPSQINFLELLFRVNPDPRSALVEYGIDLHEISEVELLNHLNEHKEDVTFYSVLILESYNSSPSFLGNDLAKFIVKDEWEEVGKWFFRKIYSDSRRRLNEGVEKIFVRAFDLLWIEQFTDRSKGTIRLIEKSWPDDFLAFGGWLVHVKEDKIDLPNNDLMIHDLSIAFSSILNEFEENVSLFISDRKYIDIFWPRNPYDIRFQYISSFLLYSAMRCEEAQWKVIRKKIESICYQIKTLYYGAHKASRLAQDMSNCLLSLLLTSPIIPVNVTVDISRVANLLSLFNNILGAQWIHSTEREGLIWDLEHNRHYADASLLYILGRLKDLDSEDPFKNEIKNRATTSWPIVFDEGVNDEL